MKKSLSVIIPVYNGEKYIDAFVQEITGQTFFAQTLIIFVNDGSNDQTYEILKKYEKMYAEQFLVITKENGGVSSARNAAMNILNTKYFSFADIDDLVHPELLERLYTIAVEYEADMVCAGIEKVSIEQALKKDELCTIKNTSQKLKETNSESAIRILLKNPEQNSVSCKIYRTELLGNVRFDERLAIAEDKLFVFQCMMKSRKIVWSEEKLYYYIQHSTSAMSYANARKKPGQDIVLDIIDQEVKAKYPQSYPLCFAIRAQIHAGSYIKVYINDKDYHEKCNYYRRSVKQCPIKYIFFELPKRATIKILLVRYFPGVFFWKRIKNRKKLI